jgi:hypothetical protein
MWYRAKSVGGLGKNNSLVETIVLNAVFPANPTMHANRSMPGHVERKREQAKLRAKIWV